MHHDILLAAVWEFVRIRPGMSGRKSDVCIRRVARLLGCVLSAGGACAGLTTGSQAVNLAGTTGAGIKVGIIDTGASTGGARRPDIVYTSRTPPDCSQRQPCGTSTLPDKYIVAHAHSHLEHKTRSLIKRRMTMLFSKPQVMGFKHLGTKKSHAYPS